MTGSVTHNPPSPSFESSLKRIEFAWTADGAGSAVDNALNLNGTLVGAAFIPSAGNAPTDQYDVTLLDQDTIDVLGGAGANLSNTVASRAFPTVGSTGLPFAVAGTCTLNVANAGAGKQGTVVLYIR